MHFYVQLSTPVKEQIDYLIHIIMNDPRSTIIWCKLLKSYLWRYETYNFVSRSSLRGHKMSNWVTFSNRQDPGFVNTQLLRALVVEHVSKFCVVT